MVGEVDDPRVKDERVDDPKTTGERSRWPKTRREQQARNVNDHNSTS
jgi:hypothetical protein